MSSSYGARFPRYLSAPVQILWWESDEVAIILAMFVGAMMIGGLFFWIGLIVVPWLYRKTKNTADRGHFKHILLSLGVAQLNGYPQYHQNKFSE